jgi:hypothetical protein
VRARSIIVIVVCAGIAIYFLATLIIKSVSQGIGIPAQVFFSGEYGPQFQKDVPAAWFVTIVEFALISFFSTF